MATTTNFGWETPDDTDYVYQGAQAMRILGGAIDTSLAELKGGTSGQVLSKASSMDMDFTWTDGYTPGGWTLLGNATPNGVSTVTISGLGGYDQYLIRYTLKVDLYSYALITFNGDSTSGHYLYVDAYANAQNSGAQWNAVTNCIGSIPAPSGSDPSGGYMELSGCLGAGNFAYSVHTLSPQPSIYVWSHKLEAGIYAAAAALSSVTFAVSSTNMVTGTNISVYGKASA